MPKKRIYYWDACIFYEWVGREEVPREKSDGILEVLAEVEAEEAMIITSVATHLEVLPQKMEAKDVDADRKYLALFDAVKFSEYQITTNVILMAREIRDFYYQPAVDAVPKTETSPEIPGKPGKMMDMGDCLHLATAIIEEADEFHTRDDNGKGAKIPLLTLYGFSGSPMICDKYPMVIRSPLAKQGTLDVDPPPKPAG